MFPSDFEGSDTALSKPPNMTDEECDPLCVQHVTCVSDIPGVMSCWKLTAEELAEVNRTGRIWLIVAGETMPPVILSGIKPIAEH